MDYRLRITICDSLRTNEVNFVAVECIAIYLFSYISAISKNASSLLKNISYYVTFVFKTISILLMDYVIPSILYY